MEISSKKEKLRRELLEKRKAISQIEFEKGSERIIASLMQQPEFSEADIIHCYVSMNDRREVNTHQFIQEILSVNKTVVVPVTNMEKGTLRHVNLPSFDVLEANNWGVLEPRGGAEIDPVSLDLVIVPMVGGDEKGNRIGYGEGFYDRFLKNVLCPTVGLLFEQNVTSEIPVENFDIPLDKIITEQRVIHRH